MKTAGVATPVAVAVTSRARCVGTRRTIQCTSTAAPIQPHVIHRAVLAVCRAREEITAQTSISIQARRRIRPVSREKRSPSRICQPYFARNAACARSITPGSVTIRAATSHHSP